MATWLRTKYLTTTSRPIRIPNEKSELSLNKKTKNNNEEEEEKSKSSFPAWTPLKSASEDTDRTRLVALSQLPTTQSSHAVPLKQSLKCKRWKKLFMPLIHLLNPQKEFFFFLNENARVTSFFIICSCDEWLLVIEKMLNCKLYILSLTEIYFSPLILFSFNWIL